MTPEELATIEARHVVVSVDGAPDYCIRDGSWFCDAFVLLAALRTEQEARARVEAAVSSVCHQHGIRPTEFLEAIRAALAPDASEGATE